MRLIIWLFAIFPSILIAEDTNNHNYIISFDAQPMARVLLSTSNKQVLSSHLETIKTQQLNAIEKLSLNYNKSYLPVFEYTHAINGFSIKLNAEEASFIASLDEVKAISQVTTLYPATDASASMVNADSLWNGTDINPLPATKGEDIVVAVIDTGINFNHEAFSDIPEDMYDFASHNPNGTDTFIGWCDPNHPNYDAIYACNNKIIGAWDFIDSIENSNEDNGPIDDNFHGSSMSSIISSNYISSPPGGFVASYGWGTLNAPFISGIAPHSHIIIYDVCSNSIGCPSDAVLAAINQAIIDGVDIINLSLSGGMLPWMSNSISMALLNANNLGILTATSAGNATAQNPETYAKVNNISPWVVTVANSYHGRTQSNDVSVISMVSIPDFLLDIYSVISDGVAIAMDIQISVIYSKDIDVNNEYGCLMWNPDDFDGVVALIKSSALSPQCSNETKIQNAQDAGAIAVIIFNADSDLPALMTGINSPTIPATMIGLQDGNNLINHIQSNLPSDTIIEIIAETTHKIVDALGMVLYHSSLRGPNNYFDVTKPDITAPGTSIFSAIAELGLPAPQYYPLTGTSQATAVTTGSLALLKSLHPTWSPSELKSAMMLTANPDITFENGDATNTDDIGSGMIDLVKAANSVLVMNETVDNYTNANPDIGGKPESLNLASLRNSYCGYSCSWTRTLTNKDTIPHTWTVSTQSDIDSEITVSESEFTLNAGDSINLNIQFKNLSNTIEEFKFGKILLTDTQALLPQSQLTLVVYLEDLIFNNGFE